MVVCPYQKREPRQVEAKVFDAFLDTNPLVVVETESFDDKAPRKMLDVIPPAVSAFSVSNDSRHSPSPDALRSSKVTTAVKIHDDRRSPRRSTNESAEELLRQSLEMLESAERQSLSYVRRWSFQEPLSETSEMPNSSFAQSEASQDSGCRPKSVVRFSDAIETYCVYEVPELTEKERARLFYSETEIDFMCAHSCA